MMQFSVKVLELEYFPNEKVSVAVSDLCVRDVDHIVIDIKVQLEQTI